MTVALPYDNISFIDWFNQLRQDLPTFEVPIVNDEKEWVTAAEILLRNPQCATLNCPWPSSFSNWREWAQRWVSAFGGQI